MLNLDPISHLHKPESVELDSLFEQLTNSYQQTPSDRLAIVFAAQHQDWLRPDKFLLGEGEVAPPVTFDDLTKLLKEEALTRYSDAKIREEQRDPTGEFPKIAGLIARPDYFRYKTEDKDFKYSFLLEVRDEYGHHLVPTLYGYSLPTKAPVVWEVTYSAVEEGCSMRPIGSFEWFEEELTLTKRHLEESGAEVLCAPMQTFMMSAVRETLETLRGKPLDAEDRIGEVKMLTVPNKPLGALFKVALEGATILVGIAYDPEKGWYVGRGKVL